MEVMLWILAVAVIGLGAVIAAGYFGALPPTITDTPRPNLPAGLLSGQDIRDTRFSISVRGYNVDQVDELLERVATQLDQSRHALREAAAFSSQGESLE
jgi:DivIVA domain-containing protein